MVENLVLESVIIGGSILGGVGRMMLPYLRKLAAAEESGQPVQYQHRYTFTTVFSVIVSAVVGMTLFPQLLANTSTNVEPLASVFITSFLTSWGSNSLFGNVIATGGNGSTPTTPTSAKPEATT